ncbi:hypothetical protein [Ranid herpesvirus 3]|uniref:Uncharacterized protein n=1 Tax=Ranid herpesvirus 3 TaxID=1987509 RepID=A0A1X9T5C5_9VIRU|nr:hypothetical protein [Ranid herpesvirus 3]ARR28901.1 hypothetical protein [Ranid herpesvirus 3]
MILDHLDTLVAHYKTFLPTNPWKVPNGKIKAKLIHKGVTGTYTLKVMKEFQVLSDDAFAVIVGNNVITLKIVPAALIQLKLKQCKSKATYAESLSIKDCDAWLRLENWMRSNGLTEGAEAAANKAHTSRLLQLFAPDCFISPFLNLKQLKEEALCQQLLDLSNGVPTVCNWYSVSELHHHWLDNALKCSFVTVNENTSTNYLSQILLNHAEQLLQLYRLVISKNLHQRHHVISVYLQRNSFAIKSSITASEQTYSVNSNHSTLVNYVACALLCYVSLKPCFFNT